MEPAPPERSERWSVWGRRAPVLAFVGVLVYAAVFWLRAGRREWFYLDEWDFLAGRRAGDLGDLFHPHNEHWVTVPVLVYRFLYWLVGLNTYFPYRLVVLAFYLTAATLLFVVIRRAGVHPWIAAAAASSFALFGAGWENAMKPFQMTFTGALAAGLGYLLLADHDGPFGRRDRIALLVGLLALMMSGVAVTLVAVVGIAVLLRRGWRFALLHVVPLATVYVVWWLAVGHTGEVRTLRPKSTLTVGGDLQFVRRGFQRAFVDIGHLSGVGWLLFAVFVAGVPLAWRARSRSRRRAELAAPFALLAGAAGFLATTAMSRSAFGPEYAGTSRYVSLTAAMLLPLLAVAADALARLWRFLLPAAVAVLLVGTPGGLRAVAATQRHTNSLYFRTRLTMLSLPRDPTASEAPRSLRPDQLSARPVTIGWLLDALDQHRLPSPPFVPIVDLVASSHFRLSFLQSDKRAPSTVCATIDRPFLLKLRRHAVVGVYDNPVFMVPSTEPYLVGFGLLFIPDEGHAVTVLRRTRMIQVTSYDPLRPARVCVGEGVAAPAPRRLPPASTPTNGR